jgi:hypothetical protein
MKKTSWPMIGWLRRTLARGVMATCVIMLVATGPFQSTLGQGDVSAIDPTVLHSLDARYTHSMFVYGHSCGRPIGGMVSMFC